MRTTLKYVWTRPSRTGKPMHYFRATSHRLLVRLPDAAGSAEFHAAYAACLKMLDTGEPAARATGSIGALVAAFKTSPEFARLAPNTRTYHSTHLECLANLAAYPAKALTRAHVLKLRDKIGHQPRSADQRVAVIRRLYSWGIDRQIVTHNPALAIGRLDVDPGSYEPWSAGERARFEKSQPPPALMTAYMIAAHASPRRGDILRLTADRLSYEVIDGVPRLMIRLLPKKTKRRGAIEHMIPAHRDLQRHIESLGIEVGLLVPGPRGKPWEPSEFSREFRSHLDSIGLTGRHLHGLRHTCATMLIEAGCSDEEAQAITTHADGGSLKVYTKRVRQRVLALSAMKKLEGRG